MKKLLLILAVATACMAFAHSAQAQVQDVYVSIPGDWYFENDDPVEVLWDLHGAPTTLYFRIPSSFPPNSQPMQLFQTYVYGASPMLSGIIQITSLTNETSGAPGSFGLKIVPYVPGQFGTPVNIHFTNLYGGRSKTIQNYQ